ncbi:MAG: hypothetical protein PF569_07370 [Candidatus Woesearchaeota archaeon]|jgi:DNA mismatch repair protein MutS2|nr:hypothetical protein [Candidatus Woesearchaeota archaeon]
MNIQDNLKQELLKKFNTESKINSIMTNYELYNFHDLTSSQLLKLFNKETQEIYTQSHAKKHLTKIFDMIKSQFFNQKTNHYANLFFNPTKEVKELKKRKEIFSSISKIDIDEESQKQIKTIINQIELINTKVSFNKTIYTLDKQIQDLLYDSYKISSLYVTKNELEEITQNQSASFILVTEEDLYVDFEIYSFKDFQKVIIGNIIKKNSKQILNLLKLLDLSSKYNKSIQSCAHQLTNNELDIDIDQIKLKELLEVDSSESLKELTNKALRLEEEVQNINKELKEIISKKQLSLGGDELLELLNSGNMQALQDKFKEDTREIISQREKEILEDFKKAKINVDFLFSNSTYPLELDEEAKANLLNQIDSVSSQLELDTYKQLGSINYKQIKKLWDYAFYLDFFNGISKFAKKYNLQYPNLGDKLELIQSRNIYIDNPMPISYGLGTNSINNEKLENEKISVLTGANSGGKTTILEMFLQIHILTNMGLPSPTSVSSTVKIFDEIIYLKKFTGTQGSGAFEQTIRNLIEILDHENSKLILIDEFEAITEPGAAAKILIEFLTELSLQNNYCIAVSHLGREIKEFIEEQRVKGIRIDGISATGLDEKGNLMTNHQPQFNQLGKSTPELILKRVLQDESFWKNKTKKSREILERIVN